MKLKLKRCPFCGGEAELMVGEHNFYDAKVRCNECYTEGPVFDADPDDPGIEKKNVADAVEHWNTRLGS